MPHASTIVAAVDIGSNTIHLIIARLSSDPQHLQILDRQVAMIRLGADVSATGAIGEERAARAIATLREMSASVAARQAKPFLAIATEGLRAAQNAPDMLTRFSEALGTPITLISGLEEASLSFWGATASIANSSRSLAVGDLGGGSCELVIGENGIIRWAHSLPLGSGRLTDAIRDQDHPTEADAKAAREKAQSLLAHLERPTLMPSQLIAVGGTANAIARFIAPDKPERISRDDLASVLKILQTNDLSTLATAHGIDLDRLRLFTGGAVAWDEILAWLHLDAMTVTPFGVREGALIAWLQAGENWQAFARDAARGM
jgi:exopolyphosphatase/pppGpp-phosphohydrolase